MRGDDAYAILKKKMQDMQGEKIQESVNRYFDENPVQAGATAEQVQQIEQNKKDVDSLKEDLTSEISRATAAEETKADKTALVKTDRKLDALWKLNQGISYEFQTDDTEAYQKTVPSGAKAASIKSIGGKTIVWNQIVVDAWEPVSGTIVNNEKVIEYTYKSLGMNNINRISNNKVKFVKNHIYMFIFGFYSTKEQSCGCTVYCEVISKVWATFSAKTVPNTWTTIAKIIKNDDIEYSYLADIRVHITGYEYAEIGDVVKYKKPQIFDLTQMFGAGNEPTTPEEFEAMFPADYYPYNAGELMNTPVNEVVEQGKNYFDFSRLVSDGVNVMDYDNQTITVPARINNTGYNQTVRDLCPGIIPGIYVLSMKYSNPEATATSYFLEAAKGFPVDESIELTDELLDNHISWYNGGSTEVENVISEIQIEKNSVKTSYSQHYQKSHKIPQAILNLPGYGWSAGDVRNEVNWENKQYIQRVGKYVITGNEFFITVYMPTVVFNNSSYMIKPGLKATNNRGLNINSSNNSGNDWQFNITDLGLDENATTDDIKEWFKEHPVTVYYPMFNEEIIDISDIIGDTFQEPLEVEAGGTLTFKNSNGDNYRIPVPSSEEYVISLAEVAK